MTARIGIDCRLAGKEHAGIGRYIAEFVPRIVAHTSVKWVLFFRKKSQFDELFPDGVNDKEIEIIYADVRHYSVAEQLRMPLIFSNANLSLLHVPHFNVPLFYKGKIVVTIHDLLWHQHRGATVTTLNPIQYWLKYWFYRHIAGHAVTKAKRIFVPSQVIAKTVTDYYPHVSNKLSVIYEGVASNLLEISKKKQSFKKNRHQLLYVGSLYPHKNVGLVLGALKKLPNYTLKIVSSRSVFAKQLQDKVKNMGLSKRVKFAPALNDKALATEYSISQALVQPSKSEGFGLTGIEAMCFGTPVLASDIPIFHEIYKQGAIYFEPNQAEQLVDSVLSLEKAAFYKKQSNNAKKVAAKYNWQTLVDQTWDTYTHAIN